MRDKRISNHQSRHAFSMVILMAVTGMQIARANGPDGVVLINQKNALEGGVTPGDAPGFPVSITQSGSYRLSSNLTVPDANTTAILVTADNVTIDLNGFSIIGPTVCTGFPVTSCSPASNGIGGQGVDATTNFSTTVINGSVRGMGGSGIFLGTGYVERVQADSNAGFGIGFRGSGTAIGNRATGNGNNGISGGLNMVVSGNQATFNLGFGIQVVCPSSVVGNAAALVNGFGSFYGILIPPVSAACALANNAF